MSERTMQVQRIAKFLMDGLNTALHGAPQTGKSWLTDGVVAEFEKASVPFVRLDLSLASSGSEAFGALCGELGVRASPDGGTFVQWKLLRKTLESRRSLVGLVLDEFDAVVRYPDSLDFLRLLRELIHRPAATHCACLIVSRRSLEAIESEVRGISTLATICVPEYARSADIDDLRTCWSEAGCLPDDDLQRCFSWSAGHPPLVRYWLSARPDEQRGHHGEHLQVVEFQRLVDHLSKAGLDDAAAQLILGPVVDDWFVESRQLQMLGIVSSDGEASPLSAHPVFRECLRQRTLDLSPWGVLGVVEIRLRGLIEERLGKRLGDDWVETVKKEHKDANRMIEEAASKQEADQRRFGRSGPWLAYTYPKDLAELIYKFWNHFDSVFVRGDKQYWKKRLDALATYRTPVAHYRVEVLGENERVQCRMYAEEVLRAISYHDGVA